MRDAQSAFDQVIAFAGTTVTLDDVTTVLGLVGRDVLFDIVRVVADEDAQGAFELSSRIVEQGYDLRVVCRELSRVVRDLLVISVDPQRVNDPEIAGEDERETLPQLAARFSREDLLRAFDVLTKAEAEIRASAQPRYSLEMALLRWIHLRKLVPLTELLESFGKGAQIGLPSPRPVGPAPAIQKVPVKAPAATAPARTSDAGSDGLKDRFLAEVRRARAVLYNTVIAQAQKIEVEGNRITFTFLATHRTLREKLDQNRTWLEQAASDIAGTRMTIVSGQQEAMQQPVVESAGSSGPPKLADLKAEAMADSAVQAMLDVFPAEIRDVEEM
jgi:DNA polymerase-3 subunit gamma/tau